MNNDTSGSTPANTSGLFTLLTFVSILMIFLVVVLSAYLRLAGSGLGCEEWPACYAQIKLRGAESVSLAMAHLIPAWATLTHRLVATTLGALILGMAVMAVRRRKQPGQNILIPLLALGLTLFLSMLGYKTPSPLIPLVTLSNLLGGMAMLAMLWWLGQRSVPAAPVADTAEAQRLRPWAWLGLALLTFQIMLGGWVSANFAALSCTTLPGCNGAHWLGADMWESFDLFRQLPLSPEKIAVVGDAGRTMHMAHRLGAIVASLYIGWLGWRSCTLGGGTRGTGVFILILLAAQIGLGLSAVAFSLPLWVVTIHNATAALLLLGLVNLIHLLTPQAKK
jgi:cytochrome c oxidase assembly protein subunit 15